MCSLVWSEQGNTIMTAHFLLTHTHMLDQEWRGTHCVPQLLSVVCLRSDWQRGRGLYTSAHCVLAGQARCPLAVVPTSHPCLFLPAYLQAARGEPVPPEAG